MTHLLAEAAEMRRDEEVGVNAGRRADRAGIEKAPDAPNICDVAAVLHDGVNAACLPGTLDDGACVGRGIGERFFGQEMAMMRERGERDLAARRGNDHVKHGERLGLIKDGVEVRADGDAVELYSRARAFARSALRSTKPTTAIPGTCLAASSQVLLMAPQPTRTTLIIPVLLPRGPSMAGIHGFA